MKIVESKLEKGLCCAYRCSKKNAKKHKFCHKHKARLDKINNPLAYTFSRLRDNAKRGGKEFLLTIEQFRRFCEETNYLELKGRSRLSASIDRIDPNKGYEVGNIQILSVSDNSKKRWEHEPF